MFGGCQGENITHLNSLLINTFLPEEIFFVEILHSLVPIST